MEKHTRKSNENTWRSNEKHMEKHGNTWIQRGKEMKHKNCRTYWFSMLMYLFWMFFLWFFWAIGFCFFYVFSSALASLGWPRVRKKSAKISKFGKPKNICKTIGNQWFCILLSFFSYAFRFFHVVAVFSLLLLCFPDSGKPRATAG